MGNLYFRPQCSSNSQKHPIACPERLAMGCTFQDLEGNWQPCLFCTIPWFNYNGNAWVFRHLKSLATELFVQQLVQVNKEALKAPHYWPFVRGVHRWPVDSPHKGPVMWEAFPYPGIMFQQTSLHMSIPQSPCVRRHWFLDDKKNILAVSEYFLPLLYEIDVQLLSMAATNLIKFL